MPIDWTRFVEIINNHQRFLLTSHLRADCDALGSELGMAAVLEALGKQVQIVNGDEIPKHLGFIDPDKKIQVLDRDVRSGSLPAFDAMMVLDTSAWKQLGPMGDILRATDAAKLVVDHHVSQDKLGAESFIDPAAEATGRLVVEAADALGVALTEAMADPLFVAIATDTGWFRFSSVTPATHQAIARLIAAGAKPPELYSQLYEQNTFARVRLRGRILAGSQTELDGRLLYSQAAQSDFVELGAERGDTEDVINVLLTVAGSEVAILFFEQPDGEVRVSFRSRSKFDVRKLAEQFGGGGHTQAAGATLHGPLSAARDSILDAARKAMR